MAASFVESGGTVCDVGCDHGKLTARLLLEDRARRVIASDIRQGPLSRAVELIGGLGLSDRVDFVLADGLAGTGREAALPPVTHVVIAGLGGVTMSKIIDEAPFLKREGLKLVLLPAQRGYRVRDYLQKNGFRVTRELAVEERGKFYSCMSAEYDGEKRELSPGRIFCGNILSERTPRAKGYLMTVLGRLRKMRRGREKGGPFPASFIDRAVEETLGRLSAFE